MTYREAIQKLRYESNTMYEKCGSLRDAATADEKEYWNKLRGLLNDVYKTYSELDNNMTDNRAAYKLSGIY